jgi:hypothetical protein
MGVSVALFCVFVCIRMRDAGGVELIKCLEREGWVRVSARATMPSTSTPKNPATSWSPIRARIWRTLRNIYRQAGWEWR